MAWNEPGSKGDNHDHDQDRAQKPKQSEGKDPWSGRPQGGGGGPPDLDEALRKLQNKLSSLFKSKSSGGGSHKKEGGGLPGGAFGLPGTIGFGFIILVVIGIWFLFGFYIVQPAQRAVMLRFGKYVETLGPGLHWVPRFIESEKKVNVQQIYTYTYPPNQDANMLTKDENIISVAVTVWYRIANPRNFLFNVLNPIISLQQATASAMRQVVGLNDLDTALTTGREQVRREVKKTLVSTIKLYNSGIKVTDVAIKSAKAPDEVKDAFDDAIKAREDKARYINQAQAYSMRVVPIADGNAKRILEEANAYKQQIVLQAQGQTAKYLALLPEYKRAPAVTRERLYLNAIESVLRESSKVLVDLKGSNNIFYLPIDKILQQGLGVPLKPQVQDESTTRSTQNTAGTPTQMNNTRTRAERPTRGGIPYTAIAENEGDY